MASDYVDDLLRDAREAYKRKETAAKTFDSRLDAFRRSAKALREAAKQLEEAFPDMTRSTIASKWGMTSTEKNIAFDAKSTLVAMPAAERKGADAPTAETAAAVRPSTGDPGGEPMPATGGSEGQAGPEGGRVMEPGHSDDPAPSEDDRPSWMTGSY